VEKKLWKLNFRKNGLGKPDRKIKKNIIIKQLKLKILKIPKLYKDNLDKEVWGGV
jgi:hypothetical protein